MNGAYSGYIDAGDKCTIKNVYGNGWVKVAYPIAGGTKTAYTQSYNFFVDTDFSSVKVSAGSSRTVYKKSSLSSSLGTVYGTDSVICVGTENSRQQIIYPVSGTNRYKMGFINGNFSDSRTGSSQNTAGRLVDYELGQLGVSDYKGNNNVPYNEWYYGGKVSGSGYAWCMAFQSYCANRCGISANVFPKTNSCNTAMNFFKRNADWHYSNYYGGNYTPKAGDVVFYGSSKNSSSHVGLITAAPFNGYLQVVEGNVLNSSTGHYSVTKFTANKKRTVSSSYVIGYAAPRY